jgi:cell division transport system permease protein
MRAWRYAFDEAIASLWRGRRSGALSTATIGVAVFVLGAFLITTTSLQRLGREWSNAAQLSVYLADGITAEERATVERTLAPGTVVASAQFVSKADALARFKKTFSDLTAAIDGLGDNPLPASYEVQLLSGSRDTVDPLVAQVRQLPGVADVRYDREWLARLDAVIGIIRGVGGVLAVMLAVAAALTVANVVRLGLYARRDELDIMELVGAPRAYVRGPFVMEGTLQGGLGALLALLALGLVFLALRGRYLVPLASAINLSAVQFLSVELCLLVVVGGMAVGCLGGLVAALGRS